MIDKRMTNRRLPVALRLCVFAYIFLATIASDAAEPNTWRFWPFRSTPKPVAANSSSKSQKLPPVVRPQAAPVQVAPASFQSPLTGSAPKNIEQLSLPPSGQSAYDLYRQTDDDVL